MKNRASTPSLEELLAHSGWVRALARSLVADGSAADDVEQQVWLTAMEKPPRHARNLKAWLSSVVRSVVGQRHREVKRRQRFDRRLEDSASSGVSGAASASSGQGSSPPDAIASRMETFQALAALVSELEEPYGSAVYLRYFEDLSVADVGRRLGVPTATAQTRLHRGVDKLRTRMKARFGLDWKQRCVIFLAPLSAAPVPVTTATVLAMSAKTKWAIATLALLAIPIYQVVFADPTADDISAVEEAMVEAVVAEGGEPAAIDPSVAELSNAQRTEASTPEPAPDALTKSHRVTVLHAGSLLPAADVEVLYFDRGNGRDREFSQALFRERLSKEDALDRFADRFRTDAAGRVDLPPRSSYAWIAARTEHKYAEVYLLDDLASNSYHEVELLLQPRLNIEVEVVDPRGNPVVGIPVVYQTQYAPGHGNNLDKVLTNEDGLATLSNMQVRFLDANPRKLHLIAVDLPLHRKLQHFFELDSPPQQRLRFQLPETVPVKVSAKHADGTSLRDGTPVLLHTDFIELPNGNHTAVGTYKMLSGQDATLAYIENGEAFFPHVGQNLSIIAGARFPGTGIQTAAGRSGTDPDFALHLVIRNGVDAISYQTQLLRPDGQPLADAVIDVDVMLRLEDALATNGVSRKQYGERHVSNASGHIGFTQENHRSYLLLTHTGSQPGLVEWGFAHIPEQVKLPNPVGNRAGNQTSHQAGKAIELPPVVMGEELIVHGTVLDYSGQPLAAAAVELRLPWVPSIHGNPHQPFEFLYLHTRSDEHGQFTIRGTLDDPSGYLGWVEQKNTASNGPQLSIAPSQESDPRDFQIFAFKLGQANQEFALADKATVAGRIMLDEGIDARELQLRLVYTPADGGAESTRFEDIDPVSGKFRFAALEPGSGQLKIQTALTQEWVAVSTPFDIQSRGNCTPSEWQSLDLRGRLFPHTVRATTADGTAIPELHISFQHEQAVWTATRSGPAHFLTPDPQTLIRLSADGHRASPLLVVGRDHTEVLSAPVSLQIQLPKTLSLPANTKWQIMARNESSMPSPGQTQQLATWTPNAAARIHPGQTSATLNLPDVGTWHLALVYCGRGTGPIDPYAPTALANLTTGQPTHRVQISNTNDPITLPIDPASISKLTNQ